MRLNWLVLERSHVDVCLKDPGHPVDATVSGPISVLVDVYLGHLSWRAARRSALRIDGPNHVVHNLGRWLQLDRVVGRDLPIIPPRAQ